MRGAAAQRRYATTGLLDAKRATQGSAEGQLARGHRVPRATCLVHLLDARVDVGRKVDDGHAVRLHVRRAAGGPGVLYQLAAAGARRGRGGTGPCERAGWAGRECWDEQVQMWAAHPDALLWAEGFRQLAVAGPCGEPRPAQDSAGRRREAARQAPLPTHLRVSTSASSWPCLSSNSAWLMALASGEKSSRNIDWPNM